MNILVTGATGSVGRMVATELAEAGMHVRALTVDPARAALPDAVTVVTGSILKPETLDGVFDGVERMYLAPAPETVVPVVEMARSAGVQHIVDLSGEPEGWWHAVAAAVESSGVAWTHLWAGEFMENSTIWADQIRRSGVVRDAYADSADAPIAMSDIAAVAATVLADGGHEGEAVTLHGPEMITSSQRVACIADALGRDIRFVEVSRDEAVVQLEPEMGEYAAWYVDGRAELLDSMPDLGSMTEAVVLEDCAVESVTGRPAVRFAEWARLNVDSFR